MKKSVFLLAVAVVAGCGTMFASMSETFSHTTPQGTVPFVDAFTLPGFNTGLGTLKDIEILLTNNSIAEVDIFNLTGTPQSFTNATASVPLMVTGPDGTTTTITTIAGPFAGTAAPGFDAFAGLASNASNFVHVAASNFGFYTNTTAGVPLNFTTAGDHGTYSGTAGPGVLFGGSAQAGGTTSVIYTYDSVLTPEPSMFGVLGLGIVGLGLATRKRSAKKS